MKYFTSAEWWLGKRSADSCYGNVFCLRTKVQELWKFKVIKKRLLARVGTSTHNMKNNPNKNLNLNKNYDIV